MIHRAGYKTAPIIEEHRDIMDQLRASKDSIDPKDYNKAVFEEYKSICKDCVKIYGWAFLTGAVTVAEIIVSNKFLRDYQKKYMGVVSLYTGLSAAFSEYRQRVIDRYGKEAEFEIHTGVKIFVTFVFSFPFLSVRTMFPTSPTPRRSPC